MTARPPRRVLVVNAGSSSLKLRVLGGQDAADDAVTDAADLPAVGAGDDDAGGAIKAAIESFGHLDAAGHRIVHGGTEYGAPVLIDAAVRRRLEALTDLAPLHQPKSLAALDAVSAVLPGVPAGLLRHRLPRHHPGPGGHLRAPAGGCAGTGSTGCPTATPPAGRPSCWATPTPATRPGSASSPATSARARHWRRSRAAARSTPPWASPRSTGW